MVVKDHPLSPQPHARRPHYMFEAPGFSPDVVGGMRGLDVLVIGPAVEHHVAIRDRFSRVGVVVDRIGIQDVRAVVDFRLAAQLEHGAIFFLLQGADGDVLLSHRGRRGWQRRLCFRFVPEPKSNWLVTMGGASSR